MTVETVEYHVEMQMECSAPAVGGRLADLPLRSLLIDFNSYFASCEQQLDVHLRGRPVGVVQMLAETTCCIAASYEAKRFGVKTGTLVREAKALCPDIVFVVAQHEKYIDFHQCALAIIERYAPIRRVLSIDEMECELTGSWQQSEKAVRIANEIKKALLQDLGGSMYTSVGIAPNTLLAKLASNMRKPDGLIVLQSDDIPHAFLHLPPHIISGIGLRMNRRLASAGIHTMADLYACPRDKLRGIWGSVAGAQMFDNLRGQWQQETQTQRHTISHSHVLPPDRRNAVGALDVLDRLTQKAAVRLRKQNLVAMGLMISVDSVRAREEVRQSWKQRVRLQGTQDTAVLLFMVRKLWEGRPAWSPIRVGLTLFDLMPEESHTQSLFSALPAPPTSGQPRNNFSVRRGGLMAVMDTINRTFGKNTLYFASGQCSKNQAPLRIAFNHIPDLETER